MSELGSHDATNEVEALRTALRDVIDPELGFNIVDLGLIYGIQVVEGRAEIVMTMTTPGCPAAGYIEAGVQQRIAAMEGIKDVQVIVTWTPPWSPDRMSEAAKQRFGLT